jgi:hypothetical protein
MPVDELHLGVSKLPNLHTIMHKTAQEGFYNTALVPALTDIDTSAAFTNEEIAMTSNNFHTSH